MSIMFCSTIVPTINHSKLAAAVQSVLNQEFAAEDFEVVVVNDTGQALPDAEWQHSERVRVLVTQRRERSVARNTGAAVARGKFLHFLDQDDVLLPGALQAFWELAQATEAAWLYGGYQSMDNGGNIISEFPAQMAGDVFAVLMAGEFVPLQASLLRAEEFFAAGAFDPGFHIVEDFDLGRRIAFIGTMAYTPALVARIRTGRTGSSGDWSRFSERWRLSYEKAFGLPDVLNRVQKSAKADGYLRGRISRQYLASLAWNLRRGNTLIATQRLLSVLALSGFSILSRDFWLGLRKVRTR
jgi:glycosyltransferase involved in cell wall biosynthesis